MKDGTLVLPVVPYEDGSFDYHLEIGTLPSEFIFPSVTGPFLRSDEDLGYPKEVVDILK